MIDGHVTKKQKTYQDNTTSWTSTRASLEDQQASAFAEEQKLKIKFLQDKHEAEIKMMAEKHKVEMDNIKLQNIRGVEKHEAEMQNLKILSDILKIKRNKLQ